jgi:tRNA threonylcarbamoyladenosine biosynthesis protein TsaB
LRLLAFDTSGAALSAAVAEGRQLLAVHDAPVARGHAELLLPALAGVIATAGLAWTDLDLFVVTVGPGNFTGLRAGVAVARALALALDRPVLGVGTLDVVAQAAADPADARPLQVVLDARRSEVYAQRFGADLEPLNGPALLSLEQLIGAWVPGWRLVGDRVPGLDGRVDEASMTEARPRAPDLVRIAWRRLRAGASPVAGTALRPLYLRAPDARPGAGASLVPATA